MLCPSCKTGELIDNRLDNLFISKKCNHCEGDWFLLNDYLAWKEISADVVQNQADVDLAAMDSADVSISETKHALICPLTGSLMIKFHINHKTQHKIDFSPNIGGIWLDKGEWELLKTFGLSNAINLIFTESWQRKIKHDASIEAIVARMKQKLGDEDYKQLMALHNWVANHPQKQMILAFLMHEQK